MSPLVQNGLVWFAKGSVIYGGLLGTAAAMTLAERKVSAWMQYRHGPNRVGPWGLLQPIADLIKFIFKEELMPDGANKWLFRLAPLIAAVPAMLAIAVIPIGGTIPDWLIPADWEVAPEHRLFSITSLDIGIMYLLAIGGLSIYGVILGGWASNSKFSLLGGLRASAQMISYELTLILSILAIVAMSGGLSLHTIVDGQKTFFQWNVFHQPLACLLFTIAAFAETNRHPFDFAECEPELVGGFHTEYSSMRFALFFLGEYCAMIVMACLSTTMFFGGYSVPFWEDAPWIVGVAAFLAKTAGFLFLYLWVRWTLPRFRFDQLMALGWKVFLPAALLNLFLTGAGLAFGVELPW